MRFSLPVVAVLAFAVPAFAQQPQQPPSAQSTTQGCNPAGRAENATPPQAGGRDSTAPGTTATGWTGNMGGSHPGSNPQGASERSPTWQAPTARGLDPIAAPVPPEAAC
jgi:hypothetical protein